MRRLMRGFLEAGPPNENKVGPCRDQRRPPQHSSPLRRASCQDSVGKEGLDASTSGPSTVGRLLSHVHGFDIGLTSGTAGSERNS